MLYVICYMLLYMFKQGLKAFWKVVTRDEFNHWLSTHEGLLDTLDDAEIDLSCKSDLFDVLDADAKWPFSGF